MKDYNNHCIFCESLNVPICSLAQVSCAPSVLWHRLDNVIVQLMLKQDSTACSYGPTGL